MKMRWVLVLILWLVASILLVYPSFWLSEDSERSYASFLTLIFGLLILGLVLGIAKEMKAIFDSGWRRPFLLFIVFFCILMNDFFWWYLNVIFNIKISYADRLFFFLLLPGCYTLLVLYRKLLMKEISEVS